MTQPEWAAAMSPPAETATSQGPHTSSPVYCSSMPAASYGKCSGIGRAAVLVDQLKEEKS
eukprot:6176655-Pleurochrysis_carterae.AAC.4